MKILCSLVLLFSLNSFSQTKGRKPVPKLPPPPTKMTALSEAELSRVDPHGAKDKKPTVAQVQQIKECTVCHGFQSQQLTTHSSALQSCTNCHNSSPHSGVPEHEKHKLTCISCHTFHRGDAIKSEVASGRFKGLKVVPPPSGFVDKSTGSAMLKKNCSDCHKW